ncbi:MAG: hypothetical protein R2708_11075 [Vicinamibacterales bacterium]
MPDARIAAIRAPTLILHAADDTLQLVRNAEMRRRDHAGPLRRFPHEGHLLLAVEQPALRDTSPPTSPRTPAATRDDD